MKIVYTLLLCSLLAGCNSNKQKISDYRTPLPDEVRIQNMLDLKWGMFLHWSLGTVTGEGWSQGTYSPDTFKVTGLNTDQWCRVAKNAGMGYIIIVSKHHDGFCLWDTKTTDFKTTNSPLRKDVLAELRRSCDKYGLKMCLYFSEADWTWPNSENAELKKAQITELFTNYGEIPLVWMDVAVWDGGLGHKETTKLIKSLQPNCFIGYNHGLPSGDLQSREMGDFNKMEEKIEPGFLTEKEIDSLVTLNKENVLALKWKEAAKQENILVENYDGYLLAENAVCIDQYNGKWFGSIMKQLKITLLVPIKY